MATVAKSFDLSGKTALITGAAGLLGRQFSKTLAEAGASLLLADQDLSSLEDVAEEIRNAGGKAISQKVDVTNPQSLKEAASKAVTEFGSLDILVNSAAINPSFDKSERSKHSSAFENYPLEAWQQSLDVNLSGAFLAAQAVIGQMLEQGSGAIVNICSTYGLVGPDQRLYQREGQPAEFKPVDYSVTKAGILGLTRYLAAYYGDRNIRVNALTPGGVANDQDHEFQKAYSARAILGRMADKDEMNAAMLFLASDASSYMTGANLVVDGGWTAW